MQKHLKTKSEKESGVCSDSGYEAAVNAPEVNEASVHNAIEVLEVQNPHTCSTQRRFLSALVSQSCKYCRCGTTSKTRHQPKQSLRSLSRVAYIFLHNLSPTVTYSAMLPCCCLPVLWCPVSHVPHCILLRRLMVLISVRWRKISTVRCMS